MRPFRKATYYEKIRCREPNDHEDISSAGSAAHSESSAIPSQFAQSNQLLVKQFDFFRSTFSNFRAKRLYFDHIPSPSFCFHFSLLIRRFLSFFCVVHFSSTVSARGRKTKSNWLGKRRQRLNWEGREKIGHRRVNYRQGRDKHQEARPVLVRQEDQLEDRWIQRGIQKSQTIKMKQVRLNSW